MTPLLFENVMQEYEHRLRHFVLTKTFIVDDVPDLMQEIWICVWRHIDSFREESSLWSWLCKIALNVRNTFYTKKSSKAAKLMLPIEQDGVQIDSPDTGIVCSDPLTVLSNIELVDNLFAIAEKRSKNTKNILNDFYMNNYSVEEIAEKEGKSYSAIIQRIFDCKQYLEKEIEHE